MRSRAGLTLIAVIVAVLALVVAWWFVELLFGVVVFALKAVFTVIIAAVIVALVMWLLRRPHDAA
ncbi:hypothetical protein CLV46_2125 [Diaminobutyricimonas aerilata]|uniref:Uncharacterized protein n=1 Tax=Diaminobutyricimonas aerilata TaxID=1162967 RepID=A0A2M9CKW5_9MICO|nr:hypothetical protein CLV46_2125 [Diaminobutyricimonas aerilata]